jgi:branched-chain amino acid transport system ATP-binding protein
MCWTTLRSGAPILGTKCTMLEVNNLQAWYGRTQALFDVSFQLDAGRCLALIGTNGAGKTTTIRAILGLVLTAGKISIADRDVSSLPTHSRVRETGISVVHEGRGMFQRMSVRENILVGLASSLHRRLDDALDQFPALSGRLNEKVSQLSGGQQQMVALARAVAQRPRLLLLDEPSLGLAPAIVDEIYAHLAGLRDTGLTILLVEQSVPRASAFADELCLIRTGHSVTRIATENKVEVDQLVSLAFGN